MSQKIIISNVTANTPVDIYYCDSSSGNCQFVSTVTVFPYEFYVEPPNDETDFLIKIVDVYNCQIGEFVYITPTPTSSLTPTLTRTPTTTPTTTQTQTVTQTQSPTNTKTPTNTPTLTATPTTTPQISEHLIGKTIFYSSGSTCSDIVSGTYYYTYISEASTIPVVGATVYQFSSNGVLYNPYAAGFNYIKMKFGGNNYVVYINPIGQILDFQICP